MVTRKQVVDATKRFVIGMGQHVRRGKKEMVAHCGHVQELLEGEISAFGETLKIKIPFDSKKKPYFCLKCLEDMTITCAYCHRPIFPYEPVSLYIASSSYIPDENSTVFSHTPLRLVGCMHPDCLDKKDDLYGFWTPNLPSCKASVSEVYQGESAFTTAMACSRHHIRGKDPNTGRRGGG